MKRCKMICVFCILITFVCTTAAAKSSEPVMPDAGAMAIDVFLARPLGLVSLALGFGTFVVSLPFSIPSGNLSVAAKRLMVDPAKFTFARPLGRQP